MSLESSKKNSSFLIDGDIETPKESSYLKEFDKVRATRFKRSTWLLSIFLIASIGVAISQFIVIKKLTNQVKELKNGQVNAPAQETIVKLSESSDSLRIEIAKLTLSNDLLLENFDPSNGIFFEIHMDFSGDFDMVQYKTELAGLISMEYDGRDKLVLGRFRSFKKALLFENDLKKMGLKDLYLLGRIDGKIMTFKEALAQAQSQNK